MKYYQLLQSILYPVEFGCFFPDDVSVYLYFVKLLSSWPIFSSVHYLMSKNILNKLITFSSHSHFTIQHYFRLIRCQAALYLDDAGFGTGKIL